ncbi:MAG: hypothetical protein WKF61_01070 [Luteimonas sp.]
MTLPASGPIGFTQLSVELGRAGGATTSLNESVVRSLAQVGGAGTVISMSSLRGKSAYTPMVVNGYGDVDEVFTNGGSGTAYLHPYVVASQGSGGYTYLWSFTSNPSSLAFDTGTFNNTHSNPTLKKGYTRYMNTVWDATLQCVITDSTNHTVTVSGIAVQMTITSDVPL